MAETETTARVALTAIITVREVSEETVKAASTVTTTVRAAVSAETETIARVAALTETVIITARAADLAETVRVVPEDLVRETAVPRATIPRSRPSRPTTVSRPTTRIRKTNTIRPE